MFLSFVVQHDLDTDQLHVGIVFSKFDIDENGLTKNLKTKGTLDQDEKSCASHP